MGKRLERWMIWINLRKTFKKKKSEKARKTEEMNDFGEGATVRRLKRGKQTLRTCKWAEGVLGSEKQRDQARREQDRGKNSKMCEREGEKCVRWSGCLRRRRTKLARGQRGKNTAEESTMNRGRGRATTSRGNLEKEKPSLDCPWMHHLSAENAARADSEGSGSLSDAFWLLGEPVSCAHHHHPPPHAQRGEKIKRKERQLHQQTTRGRQIALANFSFVFLHLRVFTFHYSW